MAEPVARPSGYKILLGDCLETMKTLPDQSVHCCVTSPPYFGLRDYGVDGQIGLEASPAEFVAKMVEVFREVRRVLRDDGTLWLNLGDSYAGSWGSQGRQGNTGQMAVRPVADARQKSKIQAARIESGAYPSKKTKTGSIDRESGLKPKDLIGIPWRVAFALQADGWYLRQDIIWHKPNPMPESVRDRCTKAHEYLFLLSKSPRYYYDHEAIKEPAKCGATPTGVGFGHGTDKVLRNRERVAYAVPAGWDTEQGAHGTIHKDGRTSRKRPSKPKGSFSGKTEAMAGTGQNAFRAVTDTRNKRSVWTVASRPFSGAHFATFPPDLIEPCILAGCPEGGTVLDPFGGSGTTAGVAVANGRGAILCELSPEYAGLVEDRVASIASKRAQLDLLRGAQ